MVKKSEWGEWTRCNILEIIILILVLILVIKAFSAPITLPVEKAPQITEEVAEGPLAEESISEEQTPEESVIEPEAIPTEEGVPEEKVE